MTDEVITEEAEATEEQKLNKDGNPVGCYATPEMIAADRKKHFENFLKTKEGRDKLNGKRAKRSAK